MKLYFAPMACSLAPHIILRELGLPFELIRVNNQTKRTAEGGSFLDINPKGYVTALTLDNGEALTEGPAILQYLADLQPEAGLAPANGSWQRVRLQEMLNFITAELHGGSAPLFRSDLPEAALQIFRDKLFQRLDWLESRLDKQDYLLPSGFGVADAYLFSILGWLPRFHIDLACWPALQAFFHRVAARPAVQAALQAEENSAPVEG
ncbi:glutathione transferase GstA [Chromobacterium sp. IIBBL 290-4]|uniref:glutathione transferase GstA n=1 Tax=Chromobacterium sp. IIBBL 290-4 TaxID=2953890 RepID=UPI0020B76169|nr:glutathione transferase GstA [Chromobacterium sp. IIBBL 290-4]UTH75992.1 glutathione transferase GstA [Chromobacterium sp. IIBBL 290-4]